MIKTTLYEEINRIKKIIEKEGDLSYGEYAFLNDHQTEIKELFPTSAELWEKAGIPENEFRKD